MPETEIIRPQRARFALADMGRSLGLVVVLVIVLLLIGPTRALILPSSKDRMPPVDYAGYVQGFNAVSSSPAVAPVGLPSSWRANAATVSHGTTSAHLHIGWAVPGSAFAGLDEGTGDPNALVRSVTGPDGLHVLGSTTIDGQQWSVRRSDRGETVFARDVNGTFVVITGNASDAQLRELAAALR